MSLNILEIVLRSCTLHRCDGSSEFSGISTTERQLAITDQQGGCGSGEGVGGVLPGEKRLSVTVGTGVPVSDTGDKVPIVKSTGPSLRNNMSAYILRDGDLYLTRTPLPYKLWSAATATWEVFRLILLL